MDWKKIILPEDMQKLAGDDVLEKIHTYYRLYDDISDIGISVYRVVLDENGLVDDTMLVYCNDEHARIFGKNKCEMLGRSSDEYFRMVSQKWLNVSYEAAYLGKKFDDTIYSPILKKFLHFTAQRAFATGYLIYNFSEVSEVPDLDKLIQKRWRTDEIIVSISQLLRSSGKLDAIMKKALKEIALHVNPTDVYVVEHIDNRRECLYEWCAPGVSPVKAVVNELPVAVAHRAWKKLVEGEQGYVVQDVEALRSFDVLLYDFYATRNVHSIILAPFYHQGEINGALIAENPMPNEEIYSKRLIEMAAFFFGAELRADRMMRRLHYVSRHDLLTGLCNRNAMEQDVTLLSKQDRPVGLVFADLNGMKQINDRDGHAAGDMVLKRTARLLELLFGENSVYRIGGDEFLVLTQRYELADFLERVNMLGVQAKYVNVSLSVGSRYIEKPETLREEMRLADREMYNAKREYYIKNPKEKLR